MSASYGPGIAWLAACTGKDPAEFTGSPAAAIAALTDALREAAALAARADSDDPRVQPEAQAELAALREQFASAPRPSDTFMTQVAVALRDAAEKLRQEGS
jgi:hypothetical protein